MLLFWPCAWGLTIAYDFEKSIEQYLFYIFLFFTGSILMRSAGCIINDIVDKDEDLYPLAVTAVRRLEKLTSINKKISNETITNIKQLKDPSKIADNIASHINATISEKQQIFETADIKKRLN